MQFSESTDSEDLHRRIDELQILNKQHIKNKGINIIAYPRSKPDAVLWIDWFRRFPSVPIQQLVLPVMQAFWINRIALKC